MRLSHDRWYSRDGLRQLQGRAYSQSSAFRKVVALSAAPRHGCGRDAAIVGSGQVRTGFFRNRAYPNLPAATTGRQSGGDFLDQKVGFPPAFDLKAETGDIDQARQAWSKL